MKYYRATSIKMTERRRADTTFKKPSGLTVLKIPNIEEIPFSPSYKRFQVLIKNKKDSGDFPTLCV